MNFRRFIPFIILVVGFLAGLMPVRASDFYVSPTGSAGGDGSINNPWDVYTAFNQPASVQPGDTLWLRGGIYTPENPSWPAIQCYLQGTANAPIIVRGYPGERAIFQEVPYPQYTGAYDQYCLYMDSGGYVWFWDFELRSTNTTRYTSVTGSDPTPTDLPIPNSCEIAAPGVKLINMVIHDTRGGIGLFAGAVDAEVYGCLIYNNGWDAPDRGHGHALYVQNQNGLMTMSDNIVFNQFGLGIHGYTVGSYEQNYLVENNAIFNNGAIGQYPDSDVGEQILFGNVSISNLNIISNYIYQPFGVYSSLLQLDYGLVNNTTGVVAGNYIAGGCTEGQYAIYANNYQSMVVTANTVYANGYMLDMLDNASSKSDYNTYYGTSGDNFNDDSGAYTFSGWQSATGYDLHSTYNLNVTPPNQIIVNPNAYQAKRANIIVYNWAGSNAVNVNVSNVLSPGDNFEVINAQNWFGPPVLVGTYSGSPISLPMTNLTTVAPNGWTNSAAVPVTGTQFNVFVIIGTNGCLNGTFSISPTNAVFGAAGGSDSVGVTVSSGCDWTAMSNDGFITITSGGSGSGDGTVHYSVAANAGTNALTGTMTIAGQTFTVTQSGAAAGPCTFTLSATNVVAASTARLGQVDVTAADGCAWTAAGNDSFIIIDSGASGSGNGTVYYRITANTNTSERAGTMTVAGQTFTVNQAGATACKFLLGRKTARFKASGGPAIVRVITRPDDCDWTAVSNDPFITITAGASGTGKGTVSYLVASNTDTLALSGTMTIAGQTFTVDQAAAACEVSLSETNAGFSAAGGSSSVAVLANGTNCIWKADVSGGFIMITSGTNGVGDGAIDYTVDADEKTAGRKGAITVGKEKLIITQSGAL